MARPEKAAAVKDITRRFEEADAALLTEYRGLKVSEIAEVRNGLRETNSEYKVLKNTLARIAARQAGFDDLVALLEGPTAIAFVKGDAAAAAKALDEAAKKFPVLVIKGGILNGKILGADDARKLARLETREVLLGKIAGLFNQPAQQAVNVFAALLRDLGSMLAQVVEQKQAEAPAEVEAPAAPTEPEAEAETEAPAEPEAETAEPETEAPAEPPEPETEAPAEPPEALDEMPAPEAEAEAQTAEVEAAAEDTPEPSEETEASASTESPQEPAEEGE